MLGDGSTQGSPVASKRSRAPPAAHRHHRQVAVERLGEPLAAPGHARRHQPGHLADGQAVAHRDRAQPHERLGVGLDVAALDLHAAERVGPVEHHHLHAGPGGRLHAPAPWSRRRCSSGCRCPADRPAARRCRPAPRRGRRQRFEARAVQAGHRDAGAGVALAVDADHVLGLAAHAVFGPEQAGGADARRDQAVDHVGRSGGDAGRMAEHAHPPAPAQVPSRLGDQDLDAGYDRHGTPPVAFAGRRAGRAGPTDGSVDAHAPGRRRRRRGRPAGTAPCGSSTSA